MDGYMYADIGYTLCAYCYYIAPGWSYGEIELIEETQDWRRIYGKWELALPSDLYTIIIDNFDGSTVYGSYKTKYFSDTGYFTGESAYNGDYWYYDRFRNSYGSLYIYRSSGMVLKHNPNDWGSPNLSFTHKGEPTYSSTFYDEFFNDDEEVGLGGQ